MKKKIFKPQDNYHALLLLPWLLISLPFELVLITDYELTLLVIVLCMNIIPTAVFVLVRSFYRIKYVVDDNYIVKFRGKKIVFKIKTEDVEAVFVKKGKWYAIFFVLLSMLCGVEPKDKVFTNISVVFKRCEIIRKEKGEMFGESLKPEEYDDFFEKNDVMSLRKCIRICEIIKKAPIYIK